MRILYICTGNSFRSPIAEALTRKYQPKFEVESAGTHIAKFVAPNAKDLLEKESASEHVKPRPDQLTQRAVDQADKIICMKKHHRMFLEDNFHTDNEEIEVWDVTDPVTGKVTPEEAFSNIKEKVQELG